MIHIGTKNNLIALRSTSVGMFLTDAEGEDGDVLLPNKYVPATLKINDTIEVFVYRDSEDRIIATTLEPLLEVEHFGSLMVKEVAPFGAFLDWGLEKDLLVPLKEQAVKMQEGKRYVVFLYLDEQSGRLVASSRLNKFLNNEWVDIRTGDEVDLLVFEDSPLGYFVVVNNRYKGLIYHNEVFQPIRVGDQLRGFVKNIKDKNEIDISLQKIGFKRVETSSDIIINYLKDHKGYLPLTDDSPAEEIVSKMNMSKKTYKKSIGILYKQRLIEIKPDGIYLANR